MIETTSKPEIKPTKPLAKSTKQLSSVVRVVAENPLITPQNAPAKAATSKVQIVSSHVEVIDDENSKKLPSSSPPKSVVHVEAIDAGSNSANSREYSTILPSRVEVVDGVSPSESCVDYKISFIVCFHSFISFFFASFLTFRFLSLQILKISHIDKLHIHHSILILSLADRHTKIFQHIPMLNGMCWN